MSNINHHDASWCSALEALHREMLLEAEFFEESIPVYQVFSAEELDAMWEAYEESLYE